MPKHVAWKTLQRKLLLDRTPWLKVFEDQIELPNGEIIDGYLHMQTPGYAMIVPVNREGEIGLIRSYKRGVDATDMQPPAGVLEEDQPLETAQRELLEETGCRAETWEALGDVVLSGNYGAGRAYFYLAMRCHQVQPPDSGDLEEQEVLWMPIQEVYKLFQRGVFQQMGATAALGLAFARLRRLGLMPDPTEVTTGDE